MARVPFLPRVICGLSLLLVLSLPQLGFYSGYSGLPPSSKTNILNSNLWLELARLVSNLLYGT